LLPESDGGRTSWRHIFETYLCLSVASAPPSALTLHHQPERANAPARGVASGPRPRPASHFEGRAEVIADFQDDRFDPQRTSPGTGL